MTKDQEAAAVTDRPGSVATSSFSAQSSLSHHSSVQAPDDVPSSRQSSAVRSQPASQRADSRTSPASGRSSASRPRSGRTSSAQHSQSKSEVSETPVKDREELSDVDSRGSARSAASSRVS